MRPVIFLLALLAVVFIILVMKRSLAFQYSNKEITSTLSISCQRKRHGIEYTAFSYSDALLSVVSIQFYILLVGGNRLESA